MACYTFCYPIICLCEFICYLLLDIALPCSRSWTITFFLNTDYLRTLYHRGQCPLTYLRRTHDPNDTRIRYDSAAAFVQDIEVSKRFYTEVLGLTIALDLGKDVILEGGITLW